MITLMLYAGAFVFFGFKGIAAVGFIHIVINMGKKAESKQQKSKPKYKGFE